MKTKQKHTLGERVVHQGEDYIVVMGGDLDNTEQPIARFARIGDANLDAAAPDLLKAVKGLQKAFDSYSAEFNPGKKIKAPADWGLINDNFCQAERAVAKAEGKGAR